MNFNDTLFNLHRKLWKGLRIDHIRKSITLMNDVFDSVSTGYFVLDKQFRIVWINEAIEQYFGISKEAVIGKSKKALLEDTIQYIFENPKEFRDRVAATYIDNTYIERFECHILAGKSREDRWVIHQSQPIHSGIYRGGRIEKYIDITERKQMETDLIESRRQYQLLAESTYELIALHSPDGTYKYVSPSVENMLGYTAEELIGTDPYDLVYPEDRERVRYKSHEPALNGENIVDLEYKIRKKNGDYVWFNTYTDLVFDENNIVKELITRSRDITDKKKIEAKLRRSEKRFRAVFKQDQSVKLLIDPGTGNILDANTAASQFYGYSLNELTHMNIKKINQLWGAEVDNKMDNARKLQENHFYFQHRLASGEIRDVEVYSTPIQYNNTRLLFSTIHDVSEKRRAEKKLEQSEEQFRKAFQSESVAVAISRQSDGTYLEVNPGFSRITGYGHDELVGKTSRELQFFTDVSRKRLMERLEQDGEIQDQELEFPSKNGELRTILFSLNPITLNNEDCFISTMVDITERKKAEQALQKSEENFRELYEKAPLGYQSLDSEGRIEHVNHAWVTTTGYSSKQTLGKRFTDLLTADSAEKFDSFFHNSAHSADPANIELELITESGDIILISCHTTITGYRHLSDFRMHGIVRNITQQKEILDTMREYAHQAENLKGIIPICASCNRIRDDEQDEKPWLSPAAYLYKRLPDTKFTHGMCEECAEKWYPANPDSEEKI